MTGMLAFLGGATLGGILWVTLLGWLFSKLGEDPSTAPRARATARAVAGYVSLALFLVVTGGLTFGWVTPLFYLPGAAIAWGMWVRKFRAEADSEAAARTFD